MPARKYYERISLPPINWSMVMAELFAAGVSVETVHRRIGASRAAVENWARGGEPGYAYGAALLELHAICVVAPRFKQKEKKNERGFEEQPANAH